MAAQQKPSTRDDFIKLILDDQQAMDPTITPERAEKFMDYINPVDIDTATMDMVFAVRGVEQMQLKTCYLLCNRQVMRQASRCLHVMLNPAGQWVEACNHLVTISNELSNWMGLLGWVMALHRIGLEREGSIFESNIFYRLGDSVWSTMTAVGDALDLGSPAQLQCLFSPWMDKRLVCRYMGFAKHINHRRRLVLQGTLGPSTDHDLSLKLSTIYEFGRLSCYYQHPAGFAITSKELICRMRGDIKFHSHDTDADRDFPDQITNLLQSCKIALVALLDEIMFDSILAHNEAAPEKTKPGVEAQEVVSRTLPSEEMHALARAYHKARCSHHPLDESDFVEHRNNITELSILESFETLETTVCGSLSVVGNNLCMSRVLDQISVIYNGFDGLCLSCMGVLEPGRCNIKMRWTSRDAQHTEREVANSVRSQSVTSSSSHTSTSDGSEFDVEIESTGNSSLDGEWSFITHGRLTQILSERFKGTI